jgi:hypothetical protein
MNLTLVIIISITLLILIPLIISFTKYNNLSGPIFVLLGIPAFIICELCSTEIRYNEDKNETEYYLYGNHELRKLFTKEELRQTPANGSGFFVLGFGGASYRGEQVSQETTVKFAWKTSDGTYLLSSVPLSKIKVNFVECNVPYVTFEYFIRKFDYENYLKNVLYVVIHCREQDWPSNIELPLN